MDAIKKYTLYMGLNDKDSKQQEINTLEAYKIVQNLLISRFDGGTITETTGIYKHDNGKVVIEKTLKIEILFADKKQVKNIVENLKEMFNQESIAVQEEVINSQLW